MAQVLRRLSPRERRDASLSSCMKRCDASEAAVRGQDGMLGRSARADLGLMTHRRPRAPSFLSPRPCRRLLCWPAAPRRVRRKPKIAGAARGRRQPQTQTQVPAAVRATSACSATLRANSCKGLLLLRRNEHCNVLRSVSMTDAVSRTGQCDQATDEPALSNEQQVPGKTLEGQDSKAKDMQPARRGLALHEHESGSRNSAASRAQVAAAAHRQTSETMVKRDINVCCGGRSCCLCCCCKSPLAVAVSRRVAHVRVAVVVAGREVLHHHLVAADTKRQLGTSPPSLPRLT
jgi:hypothetical protein